MPFQKKKATVKGDLRQMKWRKAGMGTSGEVRTIAKEPARRLKHDVKGVNPTTRCTSRSARNHRCILSAGHAGQHRITNMTTMATAATPGRYPKRAKNI